MAKAEELGVPIKELDWLKNKLKTSTDPQERQELIEMIKEEEGLFESWNPFT